MGDGNYLYSTFADRIGELADLSEKEKSEYIQDNAMAVEDYIFPAYEKLMRGLEELREVAAMKKACAVSRKAERTMSCWRAGLSAPTDCGRNAKPDPGADGG